MTNDPNGMPPGMPLNSNNMNNRNGAPLPTHMMGPGSNLEPIMMHHEYHYPAPNTTMSHFQPQQVSHPLHQQSHHPQINIQNGQYSQPSQGNFLLTPMGNNNINHNQVSNGPVTYLSPVPGSHVNMQNQVGIQNNINPNHSPHGSLPMNPHIRNQQTLYGAGVGTGSHPTVNNGFFQSSPHRAYSVYNIPGNSTYLPPSNEYNKSLHDGNGNTNTTVNAISLMEMNRNKTGYNNPLEYSAHENSSTNGGDIGLRSDGKRPSKSGSNGRWTQEEHKLFLEGLKLYSKDWRKIQAHVKTRTLVQIRSHAQKYNQKLATINKKTKGAIVVKQNGSGVNVNPAMINIQGDEKTNASVIESERALESALRVISGSTQDDSCNNLHGNIINEEGLVLMDGKRLSLKKRKTNQSTNSQGRGRRRSSLNSAYQGINDNTNNQNGKLPSPSGTHYNQNFNQIGSHTTEKVEFDPTKYGHLDKESTSNNILLSNSSQPSNFNSYAPQQFVANGHGSIPVTEIGHNSISMNSGIEKGISGPGTTSIFHSDQRVAYSPNSQVNETSSNVDQKINGENVVSNSDSPNRHSASYQYRPSQLYLSRQINPGNSGTLDGNENDGTNSPKRNHNVNINIYDINPESNSNSQSYNGPIASNSSQGNLQQAPLASPSNSSLNSFKVENPNSQGDTNMDKVMSNASLCAISRNSSSNMLNSHPGFSFSKDGYPSPLSGSPMPGNPYSSVKTDPYESGSNNLNSRPLYAPSSFPNLNSFQGATGRLYAGGSNGNQIQNREMINEGTNNSLNRNIIQEYNGQSQSSMYTPTSSYQNQSISGSQSKVEGNDHLNRSNQLPNSKRSQNPVNHHSSHPRLDVQQASSLDPNDHSDMGLDGWRLDGDTEETVKYEDEAWFISRRKRNQQDVMTNVHCSSHTMNFSATSGVDKKSAKQEIPDLQAIDDHSSHSNSITENTEDYTVPHNGSTFTVIINSCSTDEDWNSNRNIEQESNGSEGLRLQVKDEGLLPLDKEGLIHSSVASTTSPFISANGNFCDSLTEEKGSTPNAFVSSMKMNLAEKILDGDKFLNENTDITIMADKQKKIFQSVNDIDLDLETVPNSETDSVTSFFLPEKVDELEEVKLQSFYFILDYNDNSDLVRQRLN